MMPEGGHVLLGDHQIIFRELSRLALGELGQRKMPRNGQQCWRVVDRGRLPNFFFNGSSSSEFELIFFIDIIVVS